MSFFITNSWCSWNVFVWPFPIAASRKSETSNSWRHISAPSQTYSPEYLLHFPLFAFCALLCTCSLSYCVCVLCISPVYFLCISPVYFLCISPVCAACALSTAFFPELGLNYFKAGRSQLWWIPAEQSHSSNALGLTPSKARFSATI